MSRAERMRYVASRQWHHEEPDMESAKKVRAAIDVIEQEDSAKAFIRHDNQRIGAHQFVMFVDSLRRKGLVSDATWKDFSVISDEFRALEGKHSQFCQLGLKCNGVATCPHSSPDAPKELFNWSPVTPEIKNEQIRLQRLEEKAKELEEAKKKALEDARAKLADAEKAAAEAQKRLAELSGK